MEMENLTTQVGQKMRSAVKAKLIELGTGGAAGYIDDELPDYVMIMVANKRSKQQMISDLNLFLGTHTELFVTWLHEVLQKLQEVTLPTSVIQKGKRKLSESEPNVNVKKEKKEKKKKKKPSEKPTEPASISEVFANHLLEKTKKTIQVETKAKKETPIEKNSTDEFDIPTITEISEQNTVQTNREKDLSELAELQKKINQAKRQLRGLESDESEDEDFLNIKEDGEEFDEIVADKTAKKNKEGTPPAVEDQKPSEDSKENENASLLEKQRKHTPIVYSPPKQQNDSHVKKKPIYERLGYKTNKSTNDGGNFAPARRLDKELYVPTFRRKEPELESRSKNRESKKSIDSSEDDRNKSGKSNVRRRIGSRVIVAPPKPESKDEDENCVDRSINSLIKIKPRPPVSPSKQASKNLLLRAVAEAQKSTALIKPKKDFTILPSPTSPYSRIQKLYSKSYRDRNRKTVLKKVAKDNIVIEVNAEKTPLSGLQKFDEDEYIPEPISDRGDSDSEFIYIPQTINSIEEDTECENRAREIDATKNRTPQFVVTLDDKIREKYISKSKTRISGKNSTAIEIKIVPEENLENLLPSTPKSPGKKHHKKPIEVYRKAKEIKKIIIKNDTDDEESVGSSKEKDKIADGSLTPPLPKPDTPMKRKRSAVSPIKFDLSDEKEARKLKSGEREESKDDLDKDDERVKVLTKKAETSKKYENIPELLSAVSLDSSVKPKTKERCKYFPTCGKGDSCEFYHPTLPCKVFPNCKFADKCLYVHPKCKFDLTCNRIGCNFSHSAAQIASVAPPLSSHVVPVQNYKSITATPLPAMCKYYPNCTNSVCNFYHPKLCRFGKNCMNKIECNFYHHDLPNKDKFKWVASLG